MKEMLILKELGEVAIKNNIDCFILANNSAVQIANTWVNNCDILLESFSLLQRWNEIFMNDISIEFYDFVTNEWKAVRNKYSEIDKPYATSCEVSSIVEIPGQLTEKEFIHLSSRYLNCLGVPFIIITDNKRISRTHVKNKYLPFISLEPTVQKQIDALFFSISKIYYVEEIENEE